MGRDILHVDMNCFYASVEMQRRPELRNRPLAVCGSQEERHGIVLTANYLAKPKGVKTGMIGAILVAFYVGFLPRTGYGPDHPSPGPA